MLSRFKVSGVRLYGLFVVAMLLFVGIVPAFASGVTLPTIDPQPIFDGVANYLPWVFAIFAVPAGIILAIQIAKFVINSLLGAFRGNGL